MSRIASAQRVEVYDASQRLKELKRSTGSSASNDAVVNKAFDNASAFLSYLADNFSRNSWDGHGATLKVNVHVPDGFGGGPLNNAYWDPDNKDLNFGDGDGTTFSPLGNALDVVAHEGGHAVVDSEVKLVYQGQQGGLHESWADVFGMLLDNDDFLIGEEVFTPHVVGDSLRDLLHPLYKHVKELPKGQEVDVHYLSGIPNLAAARAVQKLGRGDVGQIWYKALTTQLKDNANFTEAARATIEAAAQLYGATSKQTAAVRDAWNSVGVLTPPPGAVEKPVPDDRKHIPVPLADAAAAPRFIRQAD